MRRYKLAVLTTHPIQYHAPWFRALAIHPELDFQVFFCHKATPKEHANAGFGVEFDWDLSLLDGYPHAFLKNVASHPTIGTFWGLDTPEIQEIIFKNKFDAVLVNGWHYKSAWQTIRACWKTGTPILVRGDSHLFSQRGFFKKIFKELIYRQFISRFDACLAVGEWSRNYFLHYGAAPDRVFIVPHTIDEYRFEEECERLSSLRNKLRKQWGFDDHAVVYLFSGKFIGKKRPLDFVQAIYESSSTGAPIRGLMVGDGPLRSVCEEFVKINDVPIRFAGFMNQSEIIQAYVAADALVLPSDGYETWGVVVNEAMFCGKPCIVSDRVGSGPDLVISGRTGDIFPLGDVKALAKLLVRFAKDLTSLHKMGEQARERIRSYSLDKAVREVVLTLQRIHHKAISVKKQHLPGMP
jgi:glycosyltransferase involved in cell wall biosynthesis